MRAAPGEQLAVAARLDHPAGLEHQDLIRLDHGREAMRDDQPVVSRRDAAQRYLD
jgi:hypothetical protein